MNQPATSKQSGFTLVELLVAFSILLVGMTGIIAMFSAGLSLEREATLEFEAEAAIDELAPIVRSRLLALVAQGESGNVELPLEPVPGRPGLDYEVSALAMSDLGARGGYLVRVRIIPRGRGADDAIDHGFLPMRLGREFEDLVRESPTELPRDGARR
ncbi:MAG: prepilin-type N-terminal cleavage/methylation domain-containing protein [Planctomycetes bacterium]|nr:prepilin-type N-terminal cleavage/methylation domain-containing protein [Planctomycetota bacterium]